VKITVICVGRPGRVLEAAIAEYENRARRYWTLDVVEVREERAVKGLPDAQVRSAEGERILKRLPDGAEVVALTRGGSRCASLELAREYERHAAAGGTGIAYIIGGALGLSDGVLQRARRQLQLSAFTMPHDLARLVLLEQIYRAGTILRNEPYHKGSDEDMIR
jgi:23S rRNA (pseudouridine1915-N3)-methyltransferase